MSRSEGHSPQVTEGTSRGLSLGAGVKGSKRGRGWLPARAGGAPSRVSSGENTHAQDSGAEGTRCAESAAGGRGEARFRSGVWPRLTELPRETRKWDVRRGVAGLPVETQEGESL